MTFSKTALRRWVISYQITQEGEPNTSTTMNRNFRTSDARSHPIPGGLSSNASENGDFLDADDIGDMSEGTSQTEETPASGVTAHLGSYQTKEYRRLLDIIDEVRKYDIDHVLQIPQIVVCGNTSAGKSSVLEAVSHIKFPRGDNVCTRYVTE
jgi:Dynamin family